LLFETEYGSNSAGASGSMPQGIDAKHIKDISTYKCPQLINHAKTKGIYKLMDYLIEGL